MTEALLINSKTLSTADNFASHDITYVRTDYIEVPPTTNAVNWDEGGYLEHQIAAEPLAHDVMSESYYDIEWQVQLVVKGNSFLPRLVTSWAKPPTVTAEAFTDWHLHWAQSQSPNQNYFDLILNTTATPNDWIVSTGTIGQDLVLPLPATSGFVPSQAFFHDIFDDLVFSGLNTNQVRTIESAGSGGFQYASKILEILDSCGPRYGTAEIKSVKGNRPYYAFTPEQTSVYNPYPMVSVGHQSASFTEANTLKPFINLDPAIPRSGGPVPIHTGISWSNNLLHDVNGIGHWRQSGTGEFIGMSVPSAVSDARALGKVIWTPHSTDAAAMKWLSTLATPAAVTTPADSLNHNAFYLQNFMHYQKELLPGGSQANPINIDPVMRYFANSAMSHSISQGHVVGYSLGKETDDPWHLCLTVNGEMADPYTILDQTFRGIRLNDGRTGIDHSQYGTGEPQLANFAPAGVVGGTGYLSNWVGATLWDYCWDNPYTDRSALEPVNSARYAAQFFAIQMSPNYANEFMYTIPTITAGPFAARNVNQLGQDFCDYYTYGQAPPPPNCTLWALAGVASSASTSAKSCAIYRTQLLTNKIRYLRAQWYDDASLTPAAFVMSSRDNVALQQKYSSLVAILKLLTPSERSGTFRSAYRPKDGIFQIPYDMPAYSRKTFKLRRGPFAQAYCGDPLSDLNEWIDIFAHDSGKIIPGVGSTFGMNAAFGDESGTYDPPAAPVGSLLVTRPYAKTMPHFNPFSGNGGHSAFSGTAGDPVGLYGQMCYPSNSSVTPNPLGPPALAFAGNAPGISLSAWPAGTESYTRQAQTAYLNDGVLYQPGGIGPAAPKLNFGNVLAGTANMQALRKLSPFWNSTALDVQYRLLVTRCNLRVLRHMLDNDSQTSIKRLIMEKGLAQYAVRHTNVQVIPIQAGLTRLDITLFENTPADLILTGIIRSQALLWNQQSHFNAVSAYVDGTLKAAALDGWNSGVNNAAYTANGLVLANYTPAFTARTNFISAAIKRRTANAKYVDSLCTAPIENQNCCLDEYVVNRDPATGLPYAGNGLSTEAQNAYLAINGSPSVPLSEHYLTINGQREPIIPYYPDPAPGSISGQYRNNDIPYLQFVKELSDAGYPEVQNVITKSVWNSNVRLFAYNLTTSKFPVKNQGSNLAYRKTVGSAWTFTKPVPPGYMIVALAITQQSRLQMSVNGSYNYLI